ncbi:hypothetical protein [Jatrophihabitans sp.]|jgi:hypothetical protein|uniref:hypothetical protein n=1 Tax=Jatrophihabitans sp. TaxID=1932789 RepID=UPI002F2591E0
MSKKRLLAVLAAVSALTALAVPALAVPAHAVPSYGLASPGVLPAGAVPDSSRLPTLEGGVKDLTKLTVSGYYAFNAPGLAGHRGVAYVSTPGTWADAPAAIKQLPVSQSLLPAERTSKWVVIYDPATMESGPWAPASTASATGCVAPWFCLYTGSSFSGYRCQWQSTGVWQPISGTSCATSTQSMANPRSYWSLIRRGDGNNYCARPLSEDTSLADNGFSNSTYTYNSTSTTAQSSWNC